MFEVFAVIAVAVNVVLIEFALLKGMDGGGTGAESQDPPNDFAG
jgi:hypothetical protein